MTRLAIAQTAATPDVEAGAAGAQLTCFRQSI